MIWDGVAFVALAADLELIFLSYLIDHEDCPDIRNSRVVDILQELDEYGVDLSIWDPVADPDEVHHEYGYTVIAEPKSGAYDAAVLAVKHAAIVSRGEHGLRTLLAPHGLLYDIKEVLLRNGITESLSGLITI